MKTKNFLRLSFIGVLAVLAMSCVKDKDQPAKKGFNVAAFSVQIADITATSATAKVTVAENPEAPWYGFITKDLETKAAELVEAEVKTLSVSNKILNVGDKDIPLNGLISGGFNYRYIVTGLAADGRVYGNPVDIAFRTSSDFTPETAYVINYYGIVNGEKGYYTALGFQGIQEGEYFSYTVVDAATFESLGVSEIISQDAEYVIRNDMVEDAICDEEGDDYVWDALDPGNYYVIMYGVDEDFCPTMKYAVLPISVEAASEAYQAYLGKWYTEEGEVYEIVEDVINQSYKVYGFCNSYGADAAIAANGALVIYPTLMDQTSSGLYYFVGLDSGNNLVYNKPLALGSLSEDGVNLTINGLAVSETSGIESIGALFYNGSWNPIDGVDMVDLPLALTSVEPVPLDSYNAWIGEWYSPAVEKFEIKKGIVNKTLLMSGFSGDYEVPLEFDATTGNVSFYTQVIGQEGKYYILFTGKDQDEYIEDAEQADVPYLLAVASMNADGKSFELVGNEFWARYGSTDYYEIISKLQLFAYNTSDGKYYGIDENGNDIFITPGTFTDEIPSPSEAYLAWIGNWNVQRCPEFSHAATQDDVDNGFADEIGEIVIDQEEIIDTWTISEKKVNAEYTIAGVEGIDKYEVLATFNRADGSFTVAEQDGIYEEEGIISASIYGHFNYGAYSYIGAEGDDLFTASFDANNDVDINVGGYYGGWIPFVDFQVFVYIGEQAAPYTFGDIPTLLPFVMTPAEGTSSVASAAKMDPKPSKYGKLSPDVLKKAVRSNNDKSLKARGPFHFKSQAVQFKGENPSLVEKTVPQSALRGSRINK